MITRGDPPTGPYPVFDAATIKRMKVRAGVASRLAVLRRLTPHKLRALQVTEKFGRRAQKRT